ncbi:hypothetical protein EM868_03515 [Cupriavidus gilardii]|nr:hypothetical protein [Cupriavidus gilardii]
MWILGGETYGVLTGQGAQGSILLGVYASVARRWSPLFVGAGNAAMHDAAERDDTASRAAGGVAGRIAGDAAGDAAGGAAGGAQGRAGRRAGWRAGW